jgi:hypothetical protein
MMMVKPFHHLIAGLFNKIEEILEYFNSYALAAGYIFEKTSPPNFLMKFYIRCLKHSLCSAGGNTFLTAFSRPLQASV